jgi:type II restriction enzyme
MQRGLTNIRDYAIGIEAGLDTNGRKNRGGTIMESLVDNLLVEVYNLTSRDYSTQGSPAEVQRKWGVKLPVDKSSRRPDFLIYRNQKLFWIETNFYSGGGSKLKSTCGEYKALYDFCKSNDITFIWITDGFGWKTTLKPLEEAFLHTDYIFNLSMVKDGVLRDLF